MDDWTNAKTVLITRQDGGVSIGTFRENIESEIRRWEASTGQKCVSFREITKEEIPQDRTFRNAWASDLTVDMEKARAIHMDKIRAERDKALKALDIETLKGLDVQAEKQVLRDLPQTFDLTVANTPEELKQLWPTELEK